MSYPINSPRKLIEVALPLDAINAASVREKSIRHGHPSTLHIWWARRPLATARAVIFAQLVNDPGYQQGGGFRYGMNKTDAAVERRRLFKIIEDLVKWENTTNEEVLERARVEIRRSWREVCELNKDHPEADELFNPAKMPAFHDPFAGGGAIPLEAQRLGLEAYASDLNPVAVLINKAMIEIPPKFRGQAPVGPSSYGAQSGNLDLPQEWPGAMGLAEDVRRYGAWMREEAKKRIGHLYPPVEITAEMKGERPDLEPLFEKKLDVIAWLWTRTVKSPNPAFSHVDVPLISTFVLSNKKNKEAYVQPIIRGDKYHFEVKLGAPPMNLKTGTSAGKRKAFRCLISQTPIDYPYIRSEGKAGRMGQKLLAVVVSGNSGRLYLAPTPEMEAVAATAQPTWKPNCEMPQKHRNFQPPGYGMNNLCDIFTPRQLVALTTFCDSLGEVKEKVYEDAIEAGWREDPRTLEDGGTGPLAYAEAIGVYLGFGVSRMANRLSTTCVWNKIGEKIEQVFSRQAIPMTWDFPEANVFSGSTGGWIGSLGWIPKVIEKLPLEAKGKAEQTDAANQSTSNNKIVSTDPPYYDNISYADLSDFFYVWLRKSQQTFFPDLFATLAVPKAEELIAAVGRNGNRKAAEQFFLDGMTKAMQCLATSSHQAFPVTIYYAFKQSQSRNTGTTSTGWETFLEAIIRAGFAISGTWPMRTERDFGVKTGMNVLASSVILVCTKRPSDSSTISRRDFIREINSVLPEALDGMTRGAGADQSPVAPVDLSQAIIGPGMAVFSKYAAVLEADGTPMPVRTALQLINRFLAEDDFDADTQFCLHWFEEYGWSNGQFGVADVLARSKGTSVEGVESGGVIESGGGSVRLNKWSEYPDGWDPTSDTRNPIWETLHHLIRALKQDGEAGAGGKLGAVKAQGEAVRQLAYRLYTLCERKGWAEDARAYNELITSWTGIESVAGTISTEPAQGTLFQ
jgi:putative DNA methylase